MLVLTQLEEITYPREPTLKKLHFDGFSLSPAAASLLKTVSYLSKYLSTEELHIAQILLFESYRTCSISL